MCPPSQKLLANGNGVAVLREHGLPANSDDFSDASPAEGADSAAAVPRPTEERASHAALAQAPVPTGKCHHFDGIVEADAAAVAKGITLEARSWKAHASLHEVWDAQRPSPPLRPK
eukprot:CAMPEP_0170600284 /NCGR_PEP_ID=MMETSP0224-20130122/17252_1 /TAXON_ID=285029 /ORGANISM="Togula jolla, Strain CCCM 725" /LENGTH=115 /DNA_ID=CAMNT_0010924999 /DNA_START=543 /DNA_END=890 /DNA_ORIENTATION=-